MAEDWSWVTIDKFLEFATDLNIDLRCRICGQNSPKQAALQFNAYDEREGFIPFLPSHPLDSSGRVQVSESRHVPYVRVTCARCGHMDLFSMYAISRWRNEKNAEGAKGQPNG